MALARAIRTAWAATRSTSSGLEPAGAGEAPRAVDDDPDPEALALAAGDALHPAGLDGDGLVATTDDPDVGILGAPNGGGRERSIGQVTHGARQRIR